MRISLNWLSDYLDVSPIRADLKGVLSKLTMRGLEVERIEDLSKGFDKVIVAHLEKRDRHPNADRLSVCRVNTGSEILQIVCGAQNMKSGDKVALSQVGALLPNGVKIERSKIRDVESMGMLCSEEELGLAEESEGIIVLPQDAPVGKPLAEYLGRDDVIFEINVTPNRGDALSHIGVARELASILGQQLRLPQAEYSEAQTPSSEKIKVTLRNPAEAPDVCLQYHGAYIEGVKVGPSPEWLKQRLLAVGLRPINNIVDVTNYVLMEWGQPLHAFDYRQIKGAQIQVRRAQAGEKIPLLDDTIVELTEQDLVIADAERPVAIAGVMGGGNSQVTDATTAILLEAAQFDPSSVRRTSRRHQKITDSSQRFERKIDAKAVVPAMKRAISLILQTAGGKAFKGAVGQYSSRGEQLVKGQARTLPLSVQATNAFLGVNLTRAQLQQCLGTVGFSSSGEGDVLQVSIPSYRADMSETPIVEELYEEILRVWGYEKVEARIPKLDFIPEPLHKTAVRARQIEKAKTALVEQGFSEAVNFAFTSDASNARWGGADAVRSIRLQNPLNEEFTTLKTSLVGGLIENLLLAVRHQQRDIRLFEIRPTYVRDDKSETGVHEEWQIAAVISGRAYSHALPARDRDLDFFDAKGVLETVLDTLGVRGLRYMGWEGSKTDSRLHPAQSARVALGRGPCGVIGRLHPATEAEFKLRQPLYLFEVSLDRALEVAKGDRKLSLPAKFPKVERDLSLLVSAQTAADKVLASAQKLGKPFVESVSVLDTYMGEKIPAGTVSLSISLVLADPNRTLADAEVEATMRKVLDGLDRELGVKLRTQ